MNFGIATFISFSLVVLASVCWIRNAEKANATKIVCRSFLIVGPATVLSLYLTWSVGRVALGHWPLPSLDDPKDIPWIGLPYVITLALSLSWPIAGLGSLALSISAWYRGQKEWRARLTETVLGISLLLVSFWFCRNDPNRVAEWFAD